MGCNADMQCVPIAGAGFDSCASDPDCYSESEDPETPEYPYDPPLVFHNACDYTVKACVPEL